jgi:hypothetical protein
VDARGGRLGRLPVGWWLFALASVASVALYWPAWRSPRQVWIGDTGDSVQFIWLARWTAYALAHGHVGLVTDHINYPLGVNLMWQPTPVLPNVLVAPVTLLGGPVLAYNLMATLAIPVAAVAGYAACRRVVQRPLPAAAGGLAFGFSPFLLAHSYAGHAFLDFTVLVALAFVVLHETFVRQSWRYWITGGALGLLGAATVLTAEEYLAWDGVLGALGLGLLAVLARDRVAGAVRYAWRVLAVAVAVFLPLAAYPLAVQFLGPVRLPVTGLHPTGTYVVDVLNLVLPTHQVGSDAARPVTDRFTGQPSEMSGYLGIPMLILVAVVVARQWRRTAVRWIGLCTAVVIVLALGPRPHVGGRSLPVVLPWAAVDRLPIMADALPARGMVYADLLVALLVAIFAADLADLGARGRRRWAAAGGGVLLLAALSWVPSAAPTMSLPQPAYFTGSGVAELPEGRPVLVLPYTSPGPRWNEPVLWQALAGLRFRMREGYFLMSNGQRRSFSPALTPLTRELSAIQAGRQFPRTPLRRARLYRDLAGMHLAAIVSGPSPAAEAERDFITWLLGRPPQRVGGVDLWTDLSPPASPRGHRKP